MQVKTLPQKWKMAHWNSILACIRRTLSMLSWQHLSSTSRTSLILRSHMPHIFLQVLLKGATVVSDLIKTYQKTEKVTVGQVNVESGGQAIVGNVETGSKKD